MNNTDTPFHILLDTRSILDVRYFGHPHHIVLSRSTSSGKWKATLKSNHQSKRCTFSLVAQLLSLLLPLVRALALPVEDDRQFQETLCCLQQRQCYYTVPYGDHDRISNENTIRMRVLQRRERESSDYLNGVEEHFVNTFALHA